MIDGVRTSSPITRMDSKLSESNSRADYRSIGNTLIRKYIISFSIRGSWYLAPHDHELTETSDLVPSRNLVLTLLQTTDRFRQNL